MPLLLLLFCINVCGQQPLKQDSVQIVIIDQNKDPIEWASVLNYTHTSKHKAEYRYILFGNYSNHKGKVIFPKPFKNDTIKISRTGYVDTFIVFDEIQNQTVTLQKKQEYPTLEEHPSKTLDSVLITQKTKWKVERLGYNKGSDFWGMQFPADKGIQFATRIYKPPKPAILSKIGFKHNKIKEDYYVRIRVYNIVNDKPKDDLIDSIIIIKVKSGTKKTEFDLSALNFMPPNEFAIGVDFLTNVSLEKKDFMEKNFLYLKMWNINIPKNQKLDKLKYYNSYDNFYNHSWQNLSSIFHERHPDMHKEILNFAIYCDLQMLK